MAVGLAWKGRGPRPRPATHGTYGSPSMTREPRQWGYCTNHKRVERLMAVHGVDGVTPRRFVRIILPAPFAEELPDLVQGDFSPGEPNRRYVGDIMHIPTGEGWLYLASVVDLGSRRLVGWLWPSTCAPNWSARPSSLKYPGSHRVRTQVLRQPVRSQSGLIKLSGEPGQPHTTTTG